MATASKFLFATDFRGGDTDQNVVTQADLAVARTEGVHQGRAEGRQQVLGELEASTNALAASLVRAIEILMAEMDQRTRTIEDGAIELAIAIARKAAGEAMSANRLAALETAARDGLIQARGAPHLAVRVCETMVEQVDKLMERLTREAGFAGRIVILGEPDLAPGDGRIEWADGGIVIDHGAIDRAISNIAAQAILPGADSLHEDRP
jgi:flagellar assembly protein FliH